MKERADLWTLYWCKLGFTTEKNQQGNLSRRWMKKAKKVRQTHPTNAPNPRLMSQGD